jgi:glycerophosphoryl diester phosphodiesterase
MKFIFILFHLVFILKVFSQPLVIAHRGASGHRPEHTIEAYKLAIEMGADFIEPDLVLTQDGILIARHENEISETTNVAEIFPKRKTKKVIDGEEISGWFTEDLSLKEIKTLKARQRVLTRSNKFDDQFSVPTFEEIIQLAQKHNVGIYPEIKHPTYFENIKPSNVSMISELVRLLKKYGYEKNKNQIFIQSFELSALKKIKLQIDVPLVFLLGSKSEVAFDTKGTAQEKKYLSYVDSLSDFEDLKKYITGLGPHKSYLEDAEFIKRAKKVGLQVHPYTFREGSSKEEYLKFYEMGVDGVFSDFPDAALMFKREYLKSKKMINR